MSEKKIAVVTGGARGIGKAIALELAKAGNLVVINYNGSEEKARETKAEIEAAGGQADILQCNVADFDACEAFAEGFLGVTHKRRLQREGHSLLGVLRGETP